LFFVAGIKENANKAVQPLLLLWARNEKSPEAERRD
jgi:hypothetical protein